MPLPLLALLWVAVAAASIAIVVFAILHWSEIVNWFQSRTKLMLKDKENIAFTLKKKLADGNYRVVQGIFNKNSEGVLDARDINAEKLSLETRKELGRRQLAIHR